MSAIRTEGLGKHFGAVRALDGLDLSVEEGTVFGFLGPNGAGKTTTMRILTGLARPTAGRAWIAGQELVWRGRPSMPASRARSPSAHVGYLPEEPAFYPWMTPAELLDHIARIFGLHSGERRARTGELLKLVGLSEVSQRRIGGLSRGMRQRLGIAQALVNRPQVLLLDEPASALDPAGRREVLGFVASLRGQCTVLMSTHILADVERVCDTVGIISAGRMVTVSRQQDLVARYAVPVFEVESDQATERAFSAWVTELGHMPWVASVKSDGLVARLWASEADTAKRELLASALQAGLVVTRYEMVKPSLEDIFLRLVGEEG